MRVKKGVRALKRRRNILAQTKGYRHGRKAKKRAAHEAIFHAGAHAFNHRRDKKGDFRRLWQTKINAGVRSHGLSYSVFMNLLKKKNIAINRKMLALIAEHEPEVFSQIVKHVM